MSTQATAAYTHETNAPAAAVWALFQDVAHWKTWNEGVFDCQLQGPFAVGSWMTMVLPDQTVIQSLLVEVTEQQSFTDETRLDDIVVRVQHQISALANGRQRITYAIAVEGDGAADICAGVSADFPQVLAALAAKAEAQAAP